MNRRTIVGLLVVLAVAGGLAFATGHLAQKVAVKLDFNGVTVASCTAARASALGEGGVRLICDEAPLPWDLYITHDSRTRKDGTISGLHFAAPSREAWAADPGTARLFPAELLGNLRPAVDRLECSSAIALDRKTGEAPLPQNLFGAPLPGLHVIELADPCGRLSVEIARPWG
jgi:hypothetical protein